MDRNFQAGNLAPRINGDCIGALSRVVYRSTLGPEDAAEAARLWGVKTVIPMHYGTFPVLTGTVDAFKAALSAQIALKAPAPGDTVEF